MVSFASHSLRSIKNVTEVLCMYRPFIIQPACMLELSFFLRLGCRDQTQKKNPFDYSGFKQPVDWSQKLICARTLLMKDLASPRGIGDNRNERLKNAWAEPSGDDAFRNWD